MTDRLSLRAAAAQLGISRDKLRTFAAQGAPGIVLDGRNSGVDNLDALRAWIAAQGPRVAPALSPADPRARERDAAARIVELRDGLRRGTMIDVDAALERYRESTVGFRQQWDSLPRLVHVGPGESVEAAVAAEVERILSDYTIDDPAQWPVVGDVEASPVIAAPANRGVLPVLSAGDPRHRYAAAKAAETESKAAALAESCVPRAVVLARFSEECESDRRNARTLPARVVALAATGLSLPDAIRQAADEVLTAIVAELPPEDEAEAA